jgi:uncharacterized membrane protein
MNSMKRIGVIICLALVLSILSGPVFHNTAFATSKESFSALISPPQETAPPEQIKLNSKYPSLSATSGSSYEFDVDLTYTGGDKPKIFDLRATVPQGFNYQISRSYGGGANLAAVQLDSEKSYTPETIKITVAPVFWAPPGPGEYKVVVEASSGTVKGSIELKAVVTAKYELKLETSEGLLNTNVTVGKDNYFSFKAKNTGSAALDKIDFSNSVRGGPSGWSVTFDPKNIDSLPVNGDKDVQINIKPPEKTIAGDYEITVTASTQSNNASDKLTLRVSVLTPTIWGWVGVIIVVLVVLGLIAMFWRLGRR